MMSWMEVVCAALVLTSIPLATAFQPLLPSPCTPYCSSSRDTRPSFLKVASNKKHAKTSTSLHLFHPDNNSIVTEAFAFSIFAIVGPYFARIASADRAWEERLQKERQERVAAGIDEPMSDLDFYAKSVETYPSMYGKDGLLKQREEAREARKNQRRRQRRRREDDDDEDEDDDFQTEEEATFEKNNGIRYDPYYDEPYSEDELPQNKKFVKETAFGDRIYEDGEVFFKDGDKFYRRGSKPRMKFFWKKED